MKKKKIEAAAPVKTRKSGWWITVQTVEDTILVLNIFHNRILQKRHCLNIFTHEYATFLNTTHTWTLDKLDTALGMERRETIYYYSREYEEMIHEKGRMSNEDRELVFDLLEADTTERERERGIVWTISRMEEVYGRDKREKTEIRRYERVNGLMEKIPPTPVEIKDWIDQTACGGRDYLIKDKETGQYSCSACGEIAESLVNTGHGKILKDKEMCTCPNCKKEVQVVKRKSIVQTCTYFTLIQPIDKDQSVVRHFSAAIICRPNEKKEIRIQENIRVMCRKEKEPEIDIRTGKRIKPCSIYYEQYAGYGRYMLSGYFDNKSNPANKRMYAGYLYDGGIEEAFKDTTYEAWSRVFAQMAAAGVKADYNRLMIVAENTKLVQMFELLFRGRFYNLLKESSEKISCWDSSYTGDLYRWGSDIEEVFQITDRQKINRIRDRDGGEEMLAWMQWSDENNKKISDRTLDWLLSNRLEPDDMEHTTGRFSLEQAMNYFERQKKESYPNLGIRGIISQYEDYIKMCEKLHKDTTDAIVYRPRELKRRHDEAAKECERLREQIKAEEYSQKFGEAETVLQTIREKYEYAGEKFFIRVPEKIVDIVKEGNYLHHCAGATDRYFDRIKQNETYICFLRKTEEPDIPFYTIEVEPGGTIRQHRGMLDEEPELEEVKPFLKEWQKVIRKRMSEEDHKLAAVSKRKREENIAELKEKNNTRVLNGLMEDFMEAVG